MGLVQFDDGLILHNNIINLRANGALELPLISHPICYMKSQSLVQVLWNPISWANNIHLTSIWPRLRDSNTLIFSFKYTFLDNMLIIYAKIENFSDGPTFSPKVNLEYKLYKRYNLYKQNIFKQMIHCFIV